MSLLLSGTLEINREENPFPALCVARSLVLASSLKFRIGPRLAHYLTVNGPNITDDELGDAQQKHYGHVRLDIRKMREWLSHIASSHARDGKSPIVLPAE